MARCTSFVTTTNAVTAVLLPSASIFLGISASAAKNAAAYYIKFYWEGTGTAPPAFGAAQSTTTPVAGTNLPQLSIYIPTTGIVEVQTCPVNNGGRIWYWYSTNPALADTTVLATAGDVVTLIYD